MSPACCAVMLLQVGRMTRRVEWRTCLENNEQTGEVQDDIRGIQLSNKNELSPFKHSFSLHIFFSLRIIFLLPDGARWWRKGGEDVNKSRCVPSGGRNEMKSGLSIVGTFFFFTRYFCFSWYFQYFWSRLFLLIESFGFLEVWCHVVWSVWRTGRADETPDSCTGGATRYSSCVA